MGSQHEHAQWKQSTEQGPTVQAKQGRQGKRTVQAVQGKEGQGTSAKKQQQGRKGKVFSFFLGGGAIGLFVSYTRQ